MRGNEDIFVQIRTAAIREESDLDSAASQKWEIPGEIVLAGHFDPRMVARLFSGESALQISRFSGPPAVPIHHLAAGLVARGFKPALVGGLQGISDIRIEGQGISAAIYRKRGTRAFTLTGYKQERKAALCYLHQIQPAIVHAHWTMEAARAAAQWNGPKVLTVHDLAYEYLRAGWHWHPGVIGYKVRWVANTVATLKGFDHIIAVSPSVETYLRLTHRFRGEIRMIPNAIPPLPDGVKPKTSFPKTGSITYGCYGGPDRLKNVRAAIDAYAAVARTIAGCRLIVFGDGWKQSPPQHEHLSIEFRPSLKHDDFIRALVSEIDIWVHPSRVEAFSIAICEAIQAGCPVIAGRASGAVAWTLDYGRAGLLVDVENPAEIALAMIQLARNRERASALVDYGQEMLKRRFSPDHILDLHLKYYQDVIEEWTARASR